MAIIAKEDCKQARGVSGTAHDSELDRLIPIVQDWLERYCGRLFEINTSITELRSTKSGQTILHVDQPPLNSIASIHDDPERVYGADTLIAATDYVIEDANEGKVQLDGVVFEKGIHNVKIIYSGGYAAASIPKSIKQLAIGLTWKLRLEGEQNLYGLSAKAVGDGSLQFVNLQLNGREREILDLFKLVRG